MTKQLNKKAFSGILQWDYSLDLRRGQLAGVVVDLRTGAVKRINHGAHGKP